MCVLVAAPSFWADLSRSRSLALSCQVGILDIDLCGPSIPKMLNLVGRSIYQSDAGYEVEQRKETEFERGERNTVRIERDKVIE